MCAIAFPTLTASAAPRGTAQRERQARCECVLRQRPSGEAVHCPTASEDRGVNLSCGDGPYLAIKVCVGSQERTQPAYTYLTDLKPTMDAGGRLRHRDFMENNE